MSYSKHAETQESIDILLEYVRKLNDKLRKNNVLNGQGQQWLDLNIADWQTAVDGRVEVLDTRYGYPKVYPKFRKDPKTLGRNR